MEVDGGYVVMTPGQLANGLHVVDGQGLPWRVMRVYLACFELIAIREAAARTRAKIRGSPDRTARYQVEEFQRVTRLAPATIRKALADLNRHGLIEARPDRIVILRDVLPGAEALAADLACERSERRPIPAPRRLVRYLAAQSSIAVAKTGLGYIARGLSFRRGTGEIVARGTMKASWVSDVMGLSLRAVRYAQEHLRSVGWISRDTGSTQRKLNRTGAYFEVRFEAASTIEQATVSVVEKACERASESALPGASARHAAAPPKKDFETPSELENQRAQQPQSPGVFGMGRSDPRNDCESGEGPANVEAASIPAGQPESRPEHPPTWRDVRLGDLQHLGRMEALYFEAVRRRWLPPGEAQAIDFVAAAIRAREVGREPVRVFVAITRRGLWSHITHAQEDRARRVLGRYRERHPECFRLPSAAAAAAP